MRRYNILLGLLAVITFSTIIITCSSSTDPDNEYLTNYKRDFDYLERTFFWLFWPEDSVAKIVDSRIYVFQPKDNQVEPDIIVYDAKVAVDPENFGQYSNEDQTTTVKELTPDTYNIYQDSLFLEMMTYDRTRTIAGWFEVETTSGDTVEVGNIDNDTLMLKLISLDLNASRPGLQTFRNEWRNVYSLGIKSVDPQDIELQIFYGSLGTETSDDNICHQLGTPFIQILGLDMVNNSNGSRNPDNKVDLTNRSIFWPEKGYLFFPNTRPFNPDKSYAPDNTSLLIRVPEIYNRNKSSITAYPLPYTKYYFRYRIPKQAGY